MLVELVKIIGPANAVPAIIVLARPPAITSPAATPATRRPVMPVRIALCTIEYLPPVE